MSKYPEWQVELRKAQELDQFVCQKQDEEQASLLAVVMDECGLIGSKPDEYGRRLGKYLFSLTQYDNQDYLIVEPVGLFVVADDTESRDVTDRNNTDALQEIQAELAYALDRIDSGVRWGILRLFVKRYRRQIFGRWNEWLYQKLFAGLKY